LKVTCKAADKISINELQNFQGELKTLDPLELEHLKNSLKRHGFAFPVYVWVNKKGQHKIIDGHQRVLAAREMLAGKDLKVPVAWIEAKTEKEAKEKVLLATSQYGRMNKDGLAEYLSTADLELDQILEEVSFPEIDLDEFLDKVVEGNTDDDAIPEDVEAITKLGDLWILGEHRVLCGDSTKSEDVERLMDGEKADMVFTDPPYGVSYEQGKSTGAKVKKKFEPIKNDDKRGDELKQFIKTICSNIVRVANEGCSLYVCSPAMISSLAILSGCIEAGWHMQSQLIWVKNQFILGRADYHWKHEVIWYGYVGKNHFWCGGRTQDTVWEIHKDSHSDYKHPTQKPVELSSRAINNSSKSGSNVIDLFLGSGSTLIACEKTSRKCYGMELDEKYCDVIVKRWEDFTGMKAEKGAA